MARRKIAEDVGDWFASLRFSGFTVLIVSLVVVGGLIVSPTLTTYVNQQRELAELRESVRLANEAVNKADEERDKWLDPSYVRSQARGRLFYVMPGETQLSVIDDIVIPEETEEQTSEQLTEAESNWMRSLVESTLSAGLTTASADDLATASDGEAAASADEAAAEPADEAATDPAAESAN